jgi:hypothetical protein
MGVSFLIVLLSIVIFPWAVGWIYGRNQVNPFTVQGKEHYK